MEVILAIDGGGSRTRCVAIDKHGQVVSKGESGPSNHLLVARDIVRRSLADVIHQTLTLGHLDRDDIICLSAGLAGVDFDGAGAPAMEELLNDLGFAQTVINGDMVIAHAGAFGGDEGVMALAGTGSVILGIGASGKRVKIGGWGPVYGDEGSAYRIGQMSLRAAARNYDGRGPETSLTEALLRALGLHEFRETVSRVYVEGMESRQIAALSSVAYEAAVAGDEVARTIFTQAGEELAESVAAAIRQLDFSGTEILVSYQGAVLEACVLVRECFAAALRDVFPNISIVPPRFEPVIGAYLLGCQALEWRANANVFAALEKRTASR
jgi:N-acetylglucosamine kinase-like BadF-type ATPase